jgi:hypothetical protein
MSENCRSNGVATLDAIVSGLAPGRAALTWIVGKSTWGSADTGKLKKQIVPTINNAPAINDVATGRRMNGLEMLTADLIPMRGGHSISAADERFGKSTVDSQPLRCGLTLLVSPTEAFGGAVRGLDSRPLSNPKD